MGKERSTAAVGGGGRPAKADVRRLFFGSSIRDMSMKPSFPLPLGVLCREAGAFIASKRSSTLLPGFGS